MGAALARAERLIRRHAAHLAEHPRCAWMEVACYPPNAARSIHLTVAFRDDGTAVDGVDHGALAQRVAVETGLAPDPEYTGVFRRPGRDLIIYWWDWRTAE